jgi:subtilase family serine protease
MRSRGAFDGRLSVLAGRVGRGSRWLTPWLLAAVVAVVVTPAAAGAQASFSPVCSATTGGTARCEALLSSVGGTVDGVPRGYGPADLQSAYNLRVSRAGFGQTVAIVDAFDNPNVEADLATYRSMFGLPPCTTANGCFRRVNQDGGSALPQPNIGWGAETALDVDMVSAICPNCNILLVEASGANLQHLAVAENTAAALGADAISNSYGNSEFASQTTFDSSYNHPGIAITAGTGDFGYGSSYPSSSPYVTAVGGTTLTRSSGARRWAETAWSGTGGGCSKYEPKPAWQNDPDCATRTAADVAAVADPATGVAVFDSYHYSGWLVFGGTSVGSPIVASVYALAGNADSLTGAQSTYAPSAPLFDVTSGSNGRCGGSYLCAVGPGYDGPTGNGTPNGTGAF